MIFFLIWDAVILATLAVTWLVAHRRVIRMPRVLVILSLVAFVAGAALTIADSQRLMHLIDEMKWPSVDGSVISSQIEGEQAYHPMITYSYSVADSSYTDSTDLNVPGFGTRFARLDVAKKSVEAYPVGKSLKVYYDPANPANSKLDVIPPWNVFVQLALGMTLSLLGTIGVTIKLSARGA